MVVEVLDRALAEGALANDDGPVLVAQRACHDLRGAGAVAVDQDRHRVVRRCSGVLGAVLHPATRTAVHRRYDDAVGKKRIADVDGLLQVAAGVAAQIQDQALEASARLALEPDQLGLQVPGDVGVEALDPDVADVAFKKLSLHRIHLDGVADDGEGSGLREPPAHDADGDRVTLAAPQPSHRVVEIHVDGGLAVDAHDLVVCMDASPECGRVRNGLGDDQSAVHHLDLDAQPAELTLVVDVHVFRLLGRHENGVGVQGRQRPVDEVVFDRGLVHFGRQVLLEDGGDLAQLHLHIVEVVHRSDADHGGVVAYRHGQAAPARFALEHHLGHVSLDLGKCRVEHLLGIQPVPLDVLAFQAVHVAVENGQARQVVAPSGPMDVRGLGGSAGRVFAPTEGRDGEVVATNTDRQGQPQDEDVLEDVGHQLSVPARRGAASCSQSTVSSGHRPVIRTSGLAGTGASVPPSPVAACPPADAGRTPSVPSPNVPIAETTSKHSHLMGLKYSISIDFHPHMERAGAVASSTDPG